MSQRTNVVLVVVPLALALVFGCGPRPVPDAPVADSGEGASESAISQEIWDVVGAAWRWHIQSAIRKDLEATLEIYDDDIVYASPGQPDVRGIDAVREMETATLAAADVIEAEHTSRSIQVFGDVAYEIGTVVGPVRVGDDPPRVVHYHFMAMWQRGADDGWRIRHIVGQAPPDDAS